jgi:hypothetical protein
MKQSNNARDKQREIECQIISTIHYYVISSLLDITKRKLSPAFSESTILG